MSAALNRVVIFATPENRFATASLLFSERRSSSSSSSSSSSRCGVSLRSKAFTETRRRSPGMGMGTGRSRSRGSSSLYEILRVNNNASLTEIKSAYRTLAKLYHPDASSSSSSSSSSASEFIQIHNAYATLSDPASRALYDLSLSSSAAAPSFGFYTTTTTRWETDQCW